MMIEFRVIIDKQTNERVLYVPYMNGLRHGFVKL